jgi:hypothetical protein
VSARFSARKIAPDTVYFMLILRIVAVFGGLMLVGLVVAFLVTRNKRYLIIAWLAVQIILLLAIAFALLYVFERVLLL